MSLYFFKYQGAGNDFIMIDDRQLQFPSEDKAHIAALCDRKFGVGSDGILLVQPSADADVKLDFINPDGTRSFCGNGSRCGVRFAQLLGMISERCTFEACDGIHEAHIHDAYIRIHMSNVSRPQQATLGLVLDTGSPHLILFRDDIEPLDVVQEGSEIRHSPTYAKEGINVNFVQSTGSSALSIRTYERGVEGETLACGTGVTAAALAHAQQQGLSSGTISVKALGGQLTVDFTGDSTGGFVDVWLQGPAELVFRGKWG
jgi:diaminopimelate epimerase